MQNLFSLLYSKLTSVLSFSKKDYKPQKFNYSVGACTTFDAQRLGRIDNALQKLVDEKTIPHAVTFVAHHGKVVHHKAYGWRDVENKIPCQKEDIFRIVSQTKAVTAVAVLTLFEEGKILLDEPIKKYISEFQDPQVLVSFNQKDSTYKTRPANKDITIRHLLTHTSGISYGSEEGSPFKKIFIEKGIPPFNSLENKTLAEVVRILGTCPLEHDPGEKFTYSMSLDVLGYLIEVVSGKQIDQYLKERIFEPLGMKDSFFYVPKEKQNRVVALYQEDANSTFVKHPSELYQTYPYTGAQTLFSTGAGLSGSIEDYAKFCQMIQNGGEFNGKRILGRKTIEFMRRNQVNDLRGEIGFGLAFDDFRTEYIHQSIASEGTLRWGGMFGTDYVIDPKEDLILLFYINLEPNINGKNFQFIFHNLVYQALK